MIILLLQDTFKLQSLPVFCKMCSQSGFLTISPNAWISPGCADQHKKNQAGEKNSPQTSFKGRDHFAS